LLFAAAPSGGAPRKAIWGPAIRNGVSLFPIYQALGVTIYQDRLDWSTIGEREPANPSNPDDPAYVWPAEVSWAIAEAERDHMRVALQIIGAPAWANGGKPWNWAPRNPRNFASFAIAAARRYPSVHLWMIWGEPSRHQDFEPITRAPPGKPLTAQQRVAPHLYARILDAAYGALKSVSPSNLVIGGMTASTGDISPVQWIENMRLPNGRPPRLDMYGHNPFSDRAPNPSNPPEPDGAIDFSDLGRLAGLVAHYLGRPANPRPKIFVSEWTIPTAADEQFDYWVVPLLQARWISDGLDFAARAPSIYAVGWIHLYDEPPVSYGGLIEADGTRKPGYYAFARG
jgi:hypothetical protein